MVKIKVSRNGEGYITGIEANGHSGYAEAGSDIVCAIVSTAVQSVVLCCEEVPWYVSPGLYAAMGRSKGELS